MPQFVEHFSVAMEHYGIAALFVSVMLEAFGAPLPGESAIMVASASAATGALDIHTVALAAFLAAVLGDNIGYVIGRKLGRPAIIRYGARVGVTEANMDRVEAVIAKYGPWMVITARFFVVLRQMNGIVAGTTSMRWATFMVANAVGAVLWVGLWATLAYRFGHSTEVLPFIWHHLALFAAVIIPLLIAGLVFVYWRERRHKTG